MASETVIVRAESRYTLDDIFKAMSSSGRAGGGAIQIFDPGSVISRMHLEAAYLNSLVAFKNKANRTRSAGMEMLLFASMTNQIGEAIKICGAKSNKDFILFASNRTAFSRISKLLSKSSDFKPSKQHIKGVAERYGIKVSRDIDSFMLQKIAVSRLDD
ncbi:MAG: hypothetical protein KGH60_00985 [Candidatus Micrarchaeota archaeon]|nr:hypothetical protein [Candidatus Micrarchaeota archaeon]